MTTALAGTTPTEHAQPTSGTRTASAILGGACLLVAPLLILGGALTSPPQASPAPADYIESLAKDPVISSVSATLFHYGWVAIALGSLAALGLVRGSKGRVLALIGGLGTAFGAIQMSGMLLSDWYLSSLGRHLPLDQAATVFTDMGDLSVDIWLNSAKVGALLFPVVLYLGLARAGVMPYWLAPLALGPMIVTPMLPTYLAVPAALILWAPTFFTGYRLIARGRARTV